MARRARAGTVPFRVSPMLATLVNEPFARPNWIFEEKYDGIRILAYKEGSEISLMSRNDINRTDHYAEIAAALTKLKPQTLALDGEVVVFDKKQISRFQLLQQSKGRPQYAIFDCLFADGDDLRRRPLSARRAILEKSVQTTEPLLLSARLDADGLKAFQTASKRGLEGIIGKNSSSAYVSP